MSFGVEVRVSVTAGIVYLPANGNGGDDDAGVVDGDECDEPMWRCVTVCVWPSGDVASGVNLRWQSVTISASQSYDIRHTPQTRYAVPAPGTRASTGTKSRGKSYLCAS